MKIYISSYGSNVSTPNQALQAAHEMFPVGESDSLFCGLWAFSLCKTFTCTEMLNNWNKKRQKPQTAQHDH